MKDSLFFSQKIQVRRSPVHRWGVFATDDIKSGEILEENCFIELPIGLNEFSSILLDYRYNYPRLSNKAQQVMAFGFSCVYNHSNDPSAKWETDEENRIFIFSAIKDIKKDEEIFIYYGGDNYWQDGRTHTKVI